MARRKPANKVRSEKTCKEITDLVVDYLTDRLTPNVKREFTQHLSLCPDCVSFLNTYKKTIAATKKTEPETIPANVRENVLAFLRKRIHRVGKVLLLALAQISFFPTSYL